MHKLLTTLLVVSSLVAITFNGSAQADNVVLTVENEQVTIEDFESIFRKNNRDSVTTQEALDEYIELFINFKLKVRAAKDLGMDTVSSFKTELNGYRKQLARPYLIDSELLDELIAEAYERKKNEVRASHILVKTPPNATEAQKLKAKTKAMAIKSRVDAGEDFNMVAKETSDDPSAQQNAGDLGWFSVFNMVYPFEEAAYTTPVGQVSEPTETRFGYHIVKVTDKRQAQGEVLVSHIMVKSRPESSQQSREEAEKKINEIYQILIAGANFEETVLKYSEDKSTSRKGGQLAWFGAGKMVEEFEEVAFSTPLGEFSKPFLTSYGWHIVLKVDEKPVPDFATIRSELKSKISRDSRSESTKESFLNKLKTQYNYSAEDKCYAMLLNNADSTIFDGYIPVKKAKYKTKDLFSFAGQSRSVGDFLDYLAGIRAKRHDKSPKVVFQEKYDRYVSDELLAYEDSKLESKHNAFRLLMNEYRDGILLFELTDQTVWSKAVKDSAGLAAFYEENKNDFMWPDRVQATIYEVDNLDAAKKVRRELAKPKVTAEEVKKALNEKSQLTVRTRSGLYTAEDELVLQKIEWTEGVSDNVELDGKIIVVNIQRVVPASAKQLDEAKGIITAEYQNHLEKQWIEELRARYSFEVNKEALYSIVTK